jgi:hypothetical protein
MFCAALFKGKVYGPFFFTEHTITGMIYLDILELWLWFQLPPHNHLDMREFLDEQLPQRWIWPPRSPDLSPLNFFWGFIKDYIYTLSMPQLFTELQAVALTYYQLFCIAVGLTYYY